MTKIHKKQKREIKRKQKRKALKAQNTLIAIERRRDNALRREKYKQMVKDNEKAINKKLKEALGIPEHEEVSTQKLVEAINYRNQQEKKKRDAEARKKDTVIKDAFKAQRDVDFFLRLHRHLPDNFCGGSPLGGCNYREDGKAINEMNEPVSEMQKNPDFVKKEEEILEAVGAKWKEMGWNN